MPPRPFPYPFQVGTDICSIARVKNLLAQQSKGLPQVDRFLRRVLTPPERVYFWHRFGPRPEIFTKLDSVSEFLAGRFAAKEAIRKGCHHFDRDERGLDRIIILPIETRHRSKHQSTRPQGLVLDNRYVPTCTSGKTIKDQKLVKNLDGGMITEVDALEGQLCEVSITHDCGFAMAIAIVPSGWQ
ncbi:hypothetical protein GQ44DRAFT_454371 [Phaeosphaeriaceae sp. PMI808]|nr:hypothetical protein GQ44DRAFT_454371 [Phaeosphaeriaceae sp. PMI808]